MLVRSRVIAVSFCCLSLTFQHGSMKIQTKIVNGVERPITEMPYMVSLRINGRHICGGGILNEKWGITAAHCIERYQEEKIEQEDPPTLSVQSGSTKLYQGGTQHDVSRFVIYNKYDSSTTDYDIALFKIRGSFKFSNTTRSLILPGFIPYDDSWGTAGGWGTSSPDDDSFAENLESITLPKVNKEDCYNSYGRYACAVKSKVTPRNVCYGFWEGGADTCRVRRFRWPTSHF
ncbi:trypsin-1 isoform X2 [Orussus abietinus]|uniref:trypsin-1 isoform X2 n=1 Tax=Orussus abietinus TaxID=222816 RepID=UPI0006261753|nr:trypsin-1 isoform X2 [Orussus abietinus]